MRWLRSYNAGQPPERKVRLYGIDLSGQYFPSAYLSLKGVLDFLDRADPALGRETRTRYADLIPIFRADKYPKLTAAEKESCTGKIQDLIALVRRGRTPLTAATSIEDYEWALRQAISAAQDDAFLRSLPAQFDLGVPRWWETFRPGKVWDYNAEMREVAMADNVLWVQQRECRRGRVFYFAHNEHIQAGPGAYFGDARAHEARTDHANAADLAHLISSLCRSLRLGPGWPGRGGRPGPASTGTARACTGLRRERRCSPPAPWSAG